MQPGAVTTYEVEVSAAALLPRLSSELSEGAGALATECHQEIEAGEASFAAVGGGVEAVLPITFSQYLCTEAWGRKHLFTERGVVRSLIGVRTEDGRPSLVLESFEVSGLSRLASTARADLLLKAALEREIRAINDSGALLKAYRSLGDEGFVLRAVSAEEADAGLGLRITLSGPRGEEHFRRALKRTASAFQ
jgi:hypothetical protein